MFKKATFDHFGRTVTAHILLQLNDVLITLKIWKCDIIIIF